MLMHIFGQKNGNPVNTPLLWARKVNFTKKSMLPCHANILSKNFHSLKTHLSYSAFCQNNVHSLKNVVISCYFFFKYNMENTLTPIFGQRQCQFCQNQAYSGQKSLQDAFFFFPILNERITALMVIFYKYVKSLKKALFSCPCFVKKRPFSRKHALPMSFFQVFQEKSLPVMPIFGQKCQFCQNQTVLQDKHVNRTPLFFRIFTKNDALMPKFYQTTSIL